MLIQKQSSGDVLQKGILENFAKFTGKHLCQSLFFNKVAGLRPDIGDTSVLAQTLAQVFTCEIRENFKNTFIYRTTLMAASLISFAPFHSTYLNIFHSASKLHQTLCQNPGQVFVQMSNIIQCASLYTLLLCLEFTSKHSIKKYI